MNVQNVNGADSWAQFMRVVQEARTRTQGAAMGRPVQSTTPAAKTGFALPAGTVNRSGAVYPVEKAAAALPLAPTKALGNNLDVYA